MKTDLRKYKIAVFYRFIYDKLAHEFLFGNDFGEFMRLVLGLFQINDFQFLEIKKEWKFKEDILS